MPRAAATNRKKRKATYTPEPAGSDTSALTPLERTPEPAINKPCVHCKAKKTACSRPFHELPCEGCQQDRLDCNATSPLRNYGKTRLYHSRLEQVEAEAANLRALFNNHMEHCHMRAQLAAAPPSTATTESTSARPPNTPVEPRSKQAQEEEEELFQQREKNITYHRAVTNLAPRLEQQHTTGGINLSEYIKSPSEHQELLDSPQAYMDYESTSSSPSIDSFVDSSPQQHQYYSHYSPSTSTSMLGSLSGYSLSPLTDLSPTLSVAPTTGRFSSPGPGPAPPLPGYAAISAVPSTAMMLQQVMGHEPTHGLSDDHFGGILNPLPPEQSTSSSSNNNGYLGFYGHFSNAPQFISPRVQSPLPERHQSEEEEEEPTVPRGVTPEAAAAAAQAQPTHTTGFQGYAVKRQQYFRMAKAKMDQQRRY